ncbi:MAG: hypothetical protein AAGU15_06985 [Anaerolineaceae bacterium]|jgi:hypothetical protein
MKRTLTFGKVLLFIIIAYLLIGLIYSLTGYLMDLLNEREFVFSPLVAIPFDMVGWPWRMVKDYTEGFLGMPFVVTAVAALIAFILFLRMIFRKR